MVSLDDSANSGEILKKTILLFVAGDFGLIWDAKPGPTEKYWKNILDNKPYKICFVDGNHENFYRINKLDTITKWGGRVGVYSNNIFHLKRGEIYTMDNDKKIFVFGGAVSIDKIYRREYISWWPEEIPSKAEMDYVIKNLEKHDNKVDIIITHTIPQRARKYFESKLTEYGRSIIEINCPVEKFLTHLDSYVQYTTWYTGHYNEDYDIPDSNIKMLYNRILTV